MSGDFTLREIAAIAGVSIGTVSRVLNKVKNIDPELKQKTLDAIEKSGYRLKAPGKRPSADSARRISRRAKSSRTVLMLFPEISPACRETGQIEDFINGIKRACEKRGYSTMLCMADRFEELCKSFAGNPGSCCGALIKTGADSYADAANKLTEFMPVIGMGHYEPAYLMQQAVIDDFTAGQSATEALIQEGHERIAFINPEKAHPAFIGRSLGFMSAMKKRRIFKDNLLIENECEIRIPVEPSKGLPNMKPSLEKILSMQERPSAVLCANDWNALGFYQACAEKGIQIPLDMSVMGIDDSPHAKNAAPPLASVRLHVDEMAYMAANMLLDSIEGAGQYLRGKAAALYVQPKICIRESVLNLNK